MWSQGVISTDTGDVIGMPAMTLDKVLAGDVTLRGHVEAMGPGHHRVRLGPMLIDGLECVGSAYFRARLALVCITLSVNAAKKMFGTERPPAEAELRLYQSIIGSKVGGPSPAKFSWGEIGASTDHWTGEPCIYVKFT